MHGEPIHSVGVWVFVCERACSHVCVVLMHVRAMSCRRIMQCHDYTNLLATIDFFLIDKCQY